MVNGSEVYYGKGKKVDTRTQPRNGIHDMKRINKKISNNRNKYRKFRISKIRQR